MLIDDDASNGNSSRLRRSARQTSLTSQSCRESKRLDEKQTLPTPPANRKSPRLQKLDTLVPLRSSERGKTQQHVSSTNNNGPKKSVKNSRSSDVRGKKEKQRTMDVSTLESRRNRSPVVLGKKRRHAGACREELKRKLTKPESADHDEISNGTDSASLTPSQLDDADCAKKDDSVSHSCEEGAHNLDKEKLVERSSGQVVGESSGTSCKSPRESSEKEFMAVCADDDSAPKDLDGSEASNTGVVITELCEADMMDDSAPENLQAVNLVGSSFDDKAINSGSEKIMPSYNLVHSSESVGERKTSETLFKRQRIDQDSDQLEHCSSNTTADHNSSDIVTLTDIGELKHTGVTAVSEKNSTDMQQKSCVTCKMGGELLYCGGRGCKRSYHLLCLDPPFEDMPLGVWHCPLCNTKKMESGVCSVSGVESICNTREVEDQEVELDDEGLEREKQKETADILKCSEVQNLIHDCESRHRKAKEPAINEVDIFKCLEGQNLIKDCECHHEKAKEPALNKADVFKCPEAQNLIDDYEARHEKAKEVDVNEADKAQEIMKGSSGLENDFVNKLCQYGDKRQNVTVFDDQEIASEYRNILPQLDPSGNDSNIIANLNERLMKNTYYDCKSDSSKFVEYWVPAELSNVQIERYCANLLANSLFLRSCFRNDHVGALRDVITSARKCCDHPYVEDESLGSYLVKDLDASEYLGVGIRASGKLELLDTMLQEIKNQGLRVLILFQSIDSLGRDRLRNILEDYLIQRFGQDSYECVDGALNPQKKKDAMNKFNNENSERFVFLLEARACLASIKLSSVSNVIIYDSEWCPMNDIRSLQKIKLGSKLAQIRVFRLYSSSTVEERALILAKRTSPDSQNISRSLESDNLNRITSHMLLMWGAPLLFNKLYAFHHQKEPASITSKEQLLLKVVHQEFLTILSGNVQDRDAKNSSKILKVQQCHGAYTSESPLVGEAKFQLIDEEPPHIFWTKLLDGRNPEWKYSLVSSPRNRKRTQRDAPLKRLEVVKKRKKMIANNVNQSFVTLPACDVPQCLNDSNPWVIAEQVPIHMPQSNRTSESLAATKDKRNLFDSQQNLHLSLKPEIEKLCHVLQLSEDVTNTAKEFLEYILNNHLVDREPEKMHAFQLSLCWTAASLWKHKVCHKKSLVLVEDFLNFGCTKAEAEYVNSKLRCLKKLYLYSTGKLKEPCSPKSSESGKDQSKAPSDLQKLNEDVENFPYDLKQFLSEMMMAAPRFQYLKKDFLKSISYVTKKCKKQMSKFLQRYDEENKKVEQAYHEKKEKLENGKKTETSVIRLQFMGNISMRAQKLKILDNEYEKKFEDLKREREIVLERIEAQHLGVMNTVREYEAAWVEGMKSWAKLELANPPLDNNDNKGVTMQNSETNVVVHGLRSSNVHESSGEIVDTVISPARLNGDAVILEAVKSQNGCVPMNVCCDEQIHVGDVISQVDTDNSAKHTKGAIVHLSDNGGQEQNVEDTSNIHDREFPSSMPEASDKLVEDISHVEVHSIPSQACLNGDAVILEAVKSQNGCVPMNVCCDGEIHVGDVISQVDTDNSAKHTKGAIVHLSDNGGQEQNVEDASNIHDREFPSSMPEASDNLVEDISHVEVHSIPSQGRNVEESSLADSRPLTNLSQVGQVVSSHEQLPHVISASGSRPIPEVHIANQVIETPVQVDQVRGFPVIGSAPRVRETRTLPSTSGSGFQERAAAPMAPHMHCPAISQDPLQNELDRIRKETERTIKTHEESKTRLLSDRDKKLQEAIAQIYWEYNSKFKEIDAEFKWKKDELDMANNRVALNKMLAGAFRSKWTYIAQPAALEQDMNPSVTQHLAQQTGHQRLSPVPGLHNSTFPAPNHPSTPVPLPNRPNTPFSTPNLNNRSHLRPNTSMPMLNVHNTAVPVPVLPKKSFSLAPNLHNTPAFSPHLRNTLPVRSPHLRNMQPVPGSNLQYVYAPTISPSLRSNVPRSTARPPQISSVSSVMGNGQTRSNTRAPAPRMTAYRPSTSSISGRPGQDTISLSQLTHSSEAVGISWVVIVFWGLAVLDGPILSKDDDK
ncbi:hypothetical protein ACFE04_015142 [Oxalis oulophora]